MTTPEPTYVLDANVLVQDRVRAEILAGDELETWVSGKTPSAFFHSTAKPAVVTSYTEMVRWVYGNAQFKEEAKIEFASVADGWLAAYAKAHPYHVVVTHEEYSADARKRVPLPNVCKQFDVPCIDTFAMLRILKARFVDTH